MPVRTFSAWALAAGVSGASTAAFRARITASRVSCSYEEFELALPFPVIEESQDRVRMKNDTLRLANDIITNLQNALGLDRGESIPSEVVKDIFGKISFDIK